MKVLHRTGSVKLVRSCFRPNQSFIEIANAAMQLPHCCLGREMPYTTLWLSQHIRGEGIDSPI